MLASAQLWVLEAGVWPTEDYLRGHEDGEVVLERNFVLGSKLEGYFGGFVCLTSPYEICKYCQSTSKAHAKVL